MARLPASDPRGGNDFDGGEHHDVAEPTNRQVRVIVIGMNTFGDFSTEYAQIFSVGTANIVSESINAISGPLTGLVVLWLIVQGILVMRGDISVRSGVTKIIRVSIVVALLSSLALFSTYIVSTFQTVLPNFVADALTNGTAVGVTAPHLFDQIWDYSMEMVERTNAQLPLWDVVDGVELALVQFAIGASLMASFMVYEVSQIMLGIVVGLGPFVLIGYLFDATRGIALRWIGLLIGLSLLTVLIAIALNIILNGEELFIQQAAAVGATNIQTGLATLTQATLFYALGAVIIILLPGIAAYIGAGISFGVAPVANTIVQAAHSAERPAS